MQKINDLVLKFKNLVPQVFIIKSAISDILTKELKTDKPPLFKLKDKKLYVNVSGSAKSELFTKEAEIVNKINKITGRESVEKII